MQLKKLAAALFVAGVIAPGAANATDGYFQPGYSVKSVGMGGVASPCRKMPWPPPPTPPAWP